MLYFLAKAGLLYVPDFREGPGQWGRWHYEVCKDADYLRTKVEEVVHTRM